MSPEARGRKIIQNSLQLKKFSECLIGERKMEVISQLMLTDKRAIVETFLFLANEKR
jgi:hypothetical protein